jgi:hypothetical protein
MKITTVGAVPLSTGLAHENPYSRKAMITAPVGLFEELLTVLINRSNLGHLIGSGVHLNRFSQSIKLSFAIDAGM